MATLQDKLSQYEWLFFEKGMIHVFNELQRLANKDEASPAEQLTLGTHNELADLVITGAANVDILTVLVEKVNATTPLGFTDVASVKNGGRPPTQATAP